MFTPLALFPPVRDSPIDSFETRHTLHVYTVGPGEIGVQVKHYIDFRSFLPRSTEYICRWAKTKIEISSDRKPQNVPS